MSVTPAGAILAAAVAVRTFHYFPNRWVMVAWVVAGLVCLRHERIGAGLVAVLSLGIVMESWANHLWFFMWVSLTLAIFSREQRRLVLRCQLSIVYLFTGLSKVTPQWLSGGPLGRIIADGHGVVLAPELLVAMAVGAALAELFLAAALWFPRNRPLTLTVGAVVHLSFWLGLGHPVETAPALLAFNGLAFGMLAYSTMGVPVGDDRTSWSWRDRWSER